ncbi:hypothetical protein V8F20_004350 [Naviculisporaceae sp. PSN 640]
MEDYKGQSYTVAPEPQRLIPYSRKWYLAKIILRLFCFVLGIVTMGIAININRQHGVRLAVTLPPSICVMVWCFVELSVFVIRFNVRRGIHPGFSVGGDLILWILCSLAVVCMVLLGRKLIDYTGVGWYDGYFLNWYSDVNTALTVLYGLLTVLHFTLFVRACIETKQRNDSKEENLYVYMYTPGGGRPIPVLPMKDQGGGNRAAAADELQSEAGTDWAAGNVAHSVVSPSVGITDRHTIFSSASIFGAATLANENANRPPSAVMSMPTAPPSVYSGMGMGDGFSGYQGPTDEVEAHMYHTDYGQKEIIPPGSMRLSRKELGGRS